MRIGILTFHSQTNYGGVLQCLALQQVLSRLQNDVVVLDRWFDSCNSGLTSGTRLVISGRMNWTLLLRCCLGLGDASVRRRRLRTMAFLSKWMKLTPYHFVNWTDFGANCQRAGCNLPDCLVVGSDQVWNMCSWADPRPYLLEGAPVSLRAISYAASFGRTTIPADMSELYRSGLGRFEQLSCREADGVRLCRELGFNAVHVVDPTLLLEREQWLRLFDLKEENRATTKIRRLACYFIAEDLDMLFPRLEKFARQQKCRIDLFGDSPPRSWRINMPKNWHGIKVWLSALRRRFFSPVRLRVDAGPVEFVRTLSSADAIVTDSFHAVMFSIIFKRNVRVLRPSTPGRKAMFARIEEFASHATGSLIVDGFDAALNSLMVDEKVEFDDEWIACRRAESLAWLRQALKGKG